MKVLFHIDMMGQWPHVLESVQSLLTFGKQQHIDYTVEIVVDGIAVIGLLQEVAEKQQWYLKMNDLYTQGVNIAVCKLCLGKFNPGGALPCAFATLVPFAPAELIAKQSEGYTYIKL